MKLLKFVFIVLFVAVNIAMGQGYGLEFRIELEKDVFFEGEEIIITTYLENRGNEEVEVENFTLGTAYEFGYFIAISIRFSSYDLLLPPARL